MRYLLPFLFLCAQTHWDSSLGVMAEFYFLFICFLIFQNACNEHASSLTEMVYACKLKREEKGGTLRETGPAGQSGAPAPPRPSPRALPAPDPRVPRSKGTVHSPPRYYSQPGSTRKATLEDGERPGPDSRTLQGLEVSPPPTPHRPPGPGEPFPRGCPRRPQHRSYRQSAFSRC